MSSTLPYLQRQLKPVLLELAERTSLQGYKQYNKTDLATALDEELRANQVRYSRDAAFSEFYTRMARSGGRASSDTDVVPPSIRKSPRHVLTKREDVSDEPTDNESSAPATPTHHAATRPVVQVNDGSPLSPRVVTDAIDHQTELMRQKMTEAWSTTGLVECSNSLRSALSSTKAIETLFIALEAACLARDLIPMRYVATVPAVAAISTPEFVVSVPDVFILLSSSFWAPYSLWLLTSLLLPLLVAYFFNLSLKAARDARGHESSDERTLFDPLFFNIAKALVAYRVYGERFTFAGLYSSHSINRVNASLPGHWAGVMVGSAVGAVGALYEAILRK